MKKPSYLPPDEVLKKYAQVLVNFALNSGRGVDEEEVVECLVPDVAKPLALHLQNTLLQAQAYPLVRLIPTEFSRDYFTHASSKQLTFFPEHYLRSKAELINHSISIIADVNPTELQTIDPDKIMAARNSKKPYRDWLINKENKGDFTWTLALWGVEAKANIVGLSLKDYWQQIVKACLLDKDDPVGEWKLLHTLQKDILHKLNQLKIDKIKVEGPDADLELKIGADRLWKGGSGRNMPSFEIFTSPDWRGASGWIRFNQPVYRYGNIIQDTFLRFEDGLVVEAKAKQGQKLLESMLKTPNANKVGEFSLTDGRMSRITHPMAETLYDENMGGPEGNTHLALGMAYQDCYRGDPTKVTKQQWRAMGFNDSAEHTDFVSTAPRTVTAHLTDGTHQLLYKKGRFKV